MFVRVLKSQRLLQVIQNDQIIRSYRISLGFNPIGAKERDGDGRTPEGIYQLIENTGSTKYPKSFLITYPNASDISLAKDGALAPGGDILIHGFSVKTPDTTPDHWKKDWTRGCIGITDEEMKDLYDLVPFGTTIEILP